MFFDFICLLFCLSLGAGVVYAQPVVDTGSITPPLTSLGSLVLPSPTATSQTRSTDVPVNLYTGKPQISIPLGSLEGHQLSLPITLSYNAGGIRVEEKPSWVGLGWSLSAGGCITRSMQGYADEAPGGFYRNGRLELRDFLGLVGSPTPMTYDERRSYLWLVTPDVAKPLYDTEPDIFAVSTPWWSGQFVFDMDGKIMTIPYSPVDIAINDAFTVITITTLEGIKMTFGRDEIRAKSGIEMSGSITYLLKVEDCASAWQLMRVENLLTNDFILFDYRDPTYEIIYPSTYTETKRMTHFESGPPFDSCTITPSYYRPSFQYHIPARLEKITNSKGIVEFDWDVATVSEDKPDGLLAGVVFKDHEGTFIKRYDFNYAGQFLRTLTERVTDCKMPPYKFDYYSYTDVSFSMMRQQDHWGYPNSNPEPTLIPAMASRVLGVPYYRPGADRNTDTAKVTSRALKVIHYPSGGRTELEMGSNSYYEDTPPSIDCLPIYDAYGTAPDSIVIECETDSGDICADEFLLTATRNVSYYVKGLIVAGRPEAETLFGDRATAIITRVFPTPSAVHYGWVCPEDPLTGATTGTGYCVENFAQCVELDSGHTYRFRVESSNRAYARLVLYKQTLPNKTKKGGGLRIKRIKNYDGLGSPPQITRYEYLYTAADGSVRTSGDLYSKPIYHFVTFYNTCPYLHRSTFSQAPMNTTQGAAVGYSHVTVYHGENGENGKVENVFTCSKAELGGFLNSNNDIYPFAVYAKNDDKRGMLLQQTTYKKELGSYKKVAEKFNTYTLYGDGGFHFGTSRGIKIGIINDNPPTFWGGTSGSGGMYVDYYRFVEDYRVQDYAHFSDWYYLSKTEERAYDQFDDTKFVSTTTDFFYDNEKHTQLTRSSKTTSVAGELLWTRIRYNSDILPLGSTGAPSVGSSMAQSLYLMNTLKIKAIPIETITYYKEAATSVQYLTGAKINTYKIWPFGTKRSILLDEELQYTLIRPILGVFGFYGYLTGALTSRTFTLRPGSEPVYKCLSYNSDANILSVQKDRDIVQSLVWGYGGRYPIAKADHANLNQIHHSSFEDPIYTLETSGSLAKTGERYSAGGFSGSLSSALPASPGAGTEYVLSFWVRNNAGSTGTYSLAGVSVASGSFTASADWKLIEQPFTLVGTGAGALSLNVTGADVDEVRLMPKAAQMTTFTHRPLVGMSSSTSPNHLTQYFEYDRFLRMRLVRDHDRNILKLFDYKIGHKSGVSPLSPCED